MLFFSICEILGQNFTVWKNDYVFQDCFVVSVVQNFQPVTYWYGIEPSKITCGCPFPLNSTFKWPTVALHYLNIKE